MASPVLFADVTVRRPGHQLHLWVHVCPRGLLLLGSVSAWGFYGFRPSGF